MFIPPEPDAALSELQPGSRMRRPTKFDCPTCGARASVKRGRCMTCGASVAGIENRASFLRRALRRLRGQR